MPAVQLPQEATEEEEFSFVDGWYAGVGIEISFAEPVGVYIEIFNSLLHIHQSRNVYVESVASGYIQLIKGTF